MVLVIDNYDSFTYNLVHIVGAWTDDLQVIRNDDWSVDQVREADPTGILISPGPGRPASAGITEAVIRELGPSIPLFGVCLGHQAIGEVYGAEITHARVLMHGKTSLVHHENEGVFDGLPIPFEATRYHSLVVDEGTVSDELEVTAWTEDGTIMGLRHRTHPVEGIQFHPESILTREGPRLVQNWLRRIGITPPVAASN